MNTYIRSIVTSELSKRGWTPIKSSYSGVLKKNGFIFILDGSNIDVSVKRHESANIFTYYGDNTPILGAHIFQESMPRASWHIEKNGWVITKEHDKDFNIVKVVSEYLQTGREPAKSALDAFQEHFDFIDSFSKLSDEEIKAYKHREISIDKTVKIMRHKLSKQGFTSAGSFVAEHPSLFNIFPENVIHSYERQSDVVLISQYTPDGNSFRYIDDPIPYETFEAMVNKKVIVPVDTYEATVTVTSTSWLRSVSGNNVKIPPYLSTINLPLVTFNTIVHAMRDNLNYSPLLSGKVPIESLDAYVTLLKNPGDPRILFDKAFSPDQLVFMAELREAGFPLHLVADPEYTVEYMRIRHEEALETMKVLEDRLILQGKTPKQARALALVAYRGEGFSHVNRNISDAVISFVDFCYCNDMSEFVELNIQNMATNTSAITLYYNSISVASKDILWNRFREIVPETFGGHNIERLISNLDKRIIIVRYSHSEGLHLMTSEIEVQMEYNFVKISTRSGYNWSCVKVNERSLPNGEFEENIISMF